MKVIKDGQICQSPWQRSDAVSDLGHLLLSLETFKEHREQLLTRREPVGVWLDSHEEVEELADDLPFLALIALNFPSFTDGRAYSTAVMLRRHYDYQGDIRAMGDVRKDQLEQMTRCGFSSFELAEGQPMEAALAALRIFSYSYQATSLQSTPLPRLSQVS